MTNQFTQVARIYDTLMASVPYEAWVDYVLRLVKLFEGQGDRALDVACGTGNASFALHRRGYRVTGTDVSEPMLAYARVKAEEKGVDIPFYHQDMRGLALDGSFDLTVCLFDSLNYLLTIEDVQATCAGVARHLNPGGLFIFDVNTRYALEKGFFDQSNLDSRHGPLYVWKSTFDAETRICRVTMNFMPDSEDIASQFQEIHYQKAHTVLELTAALRKAGLSVLAVYDAFTTSKPRARSDRLHFVARK